MKRPTCCGYPMERWQTQDPNLHPVVWQHWRCLRCERERDLYLGSLSWFWVEVRRADVLDGVYHQPFWMGVVGSWRNWREDTITFTVMPLNLLVDGVTRLYRWARYRKPDHFAKEMESAYRRGNVDGRSPPRMQLLDEQERRRETQEEITKLRYILGSTIIAAGGEVELSEHELLNPRQNLEITTEKVRGHSLIMRAEVRH